jgi:hypothetical protein
VHCCDFHLAWHKRVEEPCQGFDTTWGSSPTHKPRADPPSKQQVHSKVSLRRAVDAVQWCGVWFEPPSGPAATTRKQPANLAVEAAEESLSILPDYTPTVRPPPSAHDHVDQDMLQRLTCSRTATVVCMVSGVH